MLAVLAAAAEDSKDNTAVWLTLAGAIIVAAIAAITAQIRQRAQLAHDRDMQRAQLAHDRDLQDVAEVRTVVDEAVASIWRMTTSLAGLSTMAGSMVQADPDSEERDERRETFLGFRRTFLMEQHGLLAHHVRVAIRLGRESDLAVAFSDCMTACLQVRPDEDDFTVESAARFHEEVQAATKCIQRVVDEAQKAVGVDR
jgi:hypothetical protein